MTALIVLGVLFLFFFLIGQIRVGADFSITDNRIALSVTVLGFRRQLIPGKPKPAQAPQEQPAQKQEPPKKETKRPARVKKKKKLFFKIDLQDICEMLSKVAKGFRIFGRGFHIKRLLIHFTAASGNPYTTAKLSVYANAFLSVLTPLMEQKGHCRNCDVRTAIDFDKLCPELDFGICVTFRIGAAVEMAFYTLFGLIGIFLKIIFRFLWMKWRDPEEYDFRMNQQENPITFFRRVFRESREQREKNGVIRDFDPGRTAADSEKTEAENRADLRKAAEQYASETGAVLSAEPVETYPEKTTKDTSEERNNSDGQHKE